jgi:hypothetical protein
VCFGFEENIFVRLVAGCERLITFQRNFCNRVADIFGVGRTVQVEWVKIGGQVMSECQRNEQEKKGS